MKNHHKWGLRGRLYYHTFASLTRILIQKVMDEIVVNKLIYVRLIMVEDLL